MNFNFHKSFKFRIMSAFFAIFSVAIILFLGYNYYNNQKIDHEELLLKVANLKSDITKNTTNFQSFLLYGYKSDSFYDTNEEENIDRYIKHIELQRDGLKSIQESFSAIGKNDRFLSLVKKLEDEFKVLKAKAVNLKAKQYKLGYRDFGKIGEMRNEAHNIEDNRLVANEDILKLRRNEKDFLLRSDTIYVKLFNNNIKSLSIDNENNQDVLEALSRYQNYFNQVAEYYLEIGKTSNTGLYVDILSINSSISIIVEQIQDLSKDEIIIRNKAIKEFVILAIMGMFFVLGILMVFFSNHLTRDLKRLKSSINTFINSGFKSYDESKDHEESSILEVNFLFKAYNHLKENLLKNIEGLNLTIDELERTAAYKSSFLANMSHEIRTPLNGIISAVNLLNQTELNKDQKELLEVADFSSSHLLGLINLILDYSKISAGKMTLENRAIDLQDDLSKLIKIFKFQATEKGIDLYFDFKKSGEVSRFVYGDTVRIHQVIINLLNNAIKFTQKGWVRFTIQQQEIDDVFDELKFSVEDTGIGIKDDKVHKIFQAFEQEDLSTTRRYGGTGLGLTISNDLVKLMNGELRYKPSSEHGACFYFTLKLKRAKRETNDVNGLDLMKKLPRLDKTINALVVDDNIMNQKVLGMMLKKFNIQIDYANNGLEAIDQYKIYDYDMIFMDIQMPILDGLNATERIKKTSKYQDNPIPIIAVSASTYSDDKSAARNAGINEFISKPIEVKKLHDVLIKYSLKL